MPMFKVLRDGWLLGMRYTAGEVVQLDMAAAKYALLTGQVAHHAPTKAPRKPKAKAGKSQ